MLDVESYYSFLREKIVIKQRAALNITDGMLHPENKPHQNDMIRFALSRGQALIAASFGMGKTRVQCEIARLVVEHYPGSKFMIVCPLGVKYQFQQKDGPALGMDWVYCRTDAEIEASPSPYIITNYERVRDGGIDPRKHNISGCSLDEGSVIHSLGAVTTTKFKKLFKKVLFKFVATATPSPNEYRELIYYADYLGVMDTGQALTRFFMRNPDKAGDLRINPIHEHEFWMWVASWAIFLYSPADLGYSDEGYNLPGLNVHWVRINADQTRAFQQKDKFGQGRLLLDASAGVTEAATEARETVRDRVGAAVGIMDENPGRNWLLWHNREDERHAIGKAIPGAVAVYGSQPLEIKEQRIIDFADGKTNILATKPSLTGSGCNFQYACYSNIFIGIDYKFKDLIQAIHRTYRFQQEHVVDVWIVYTESQDEVAAAMRRKWQQHDELVLRMREIVKTYGLSQNALYADLARTIGVMRQMSEQKLFTTINNDCILEVGQMPDNSVHLIWTSVPFGNHYEYTSLVNDLGHNPSDQDYHKQMDFLFPELLRVLKPGRIMALHVKDRIVYSHQTASELMEVAPFSDECVMEARKHGFMYMGRRTVVTDVVRENNGSYRLGWSEATKDMSKMGCGLSEYILIFRKPPTDKSTSYADEKVSKTKEAYGVARWQIDAHGYWRSDGNGPLSLFELYNYKAHVERMEAKARKNQLSKTYMMNPPESPYDWVWTDVHFMGNLNAEQMKKRQNKHICPLPFDLVERIIALYSNEGEIVLDPFAGLFTVPYMAVKMGRIGWGIELNPDYYAAGLKYMEAAQREKMIPTLFDWLSTMEGEKEKA